MNETKIGAYRIIRKLGEGGMGAVFEALHEEIERRVAIKILHPEFAKSPEFTTRFFNEARAVNRVDHLGLVQISDYSLLPDGTAYIVMEFLKGESLGSRLKRLGGPMAVEEVIYLCRQIADALAAAHDKSIVHRDLKPDNVMIIPDPAMSGGERTKLLDFGIAKLVEHVDKAQLKTRTNALMGTPVYMSPEQCRGAASVDDKSDVYSLGVMLYVMLTGRQPFTGEGTGEIIAKHIYEAPPPISGIASWVPQPLAELVHGLLAKDKQQRPTMHQVVDALDAFVGQSVARNRRSSGKLPMLLLTTGQNRLMDRPSTLGLSAGQSQVSLTVSRRWLVGALAAGGFLALLAVGYVRRAKQPFPMIPATPAAIQPPVVQETTVAPKKVRWIVRSTPPGAEVVRFKDGLVLGKTPWQFEQLAVSGELKLSLKLLGYQESVLDLSLGADAEVEEILRAAPAAPLDPTAKPPVAVPPILRPAGVIAGVRPRSAKKQIGKPEIAAGGPDGTSSPTPTPTSADHSDLAKATLVKPNPPLLETPVSSSPKTKSYDD